MSKIPETKKFQKAAEPSKKEEAPEPEIAAPIPHDDNIEQSEVAEEGIGENEVIESQESFNPLVNEMKNKVKCIAFMESYLTMKILTVDLSEEMLDAVKKELLSPEADIKSKISSGLVKLGLVSKDINEIVKKKNHKPFDINELINLDNIEDGSKVVNDLKKKKIRLDSTIELLGKQYKLEEAKLSIIEKKVLTSKIRDYKAEREEVSGKISNVENYLGSVKHKVSLPVIRNPQRLRQERRQYLSQFKHDLEKAESKVKEWNQKRITIQDGVNKQIKKQEELVEKLTEKELEELAKQENERKEQMLIRREKYIEASKKTHEEVSKLTNEPIKHKTYLFMLNEKKMKQEEFKEKEKLEATLKELKSVKKSRVPDQESITEFQEKVDQMLIEASEKIKSKKEKPEKKEHDEEKQEVYQSYFYNKIIEEQQQKNEVASQEKARHKDNIDRKNKFVKEINLPTINPQKAKEMTELKTKSLGMHLFNPLNQSKAFMKRKKKLSKFNLKLKNIMKQLEKSIQKKARSANSNSPSMLDNSSRTQNHKPLFTTEVYRNSQSPSVRTDSKIMNLSKHASRYQLTESIRSPTQRRKPLNKYPDYLKEVRPINIQHGYSETLSALESNKKDDLYTKISNAKDKARTLETIVEHKHLLLKVSGGPSKNPKAEADLANSLLQAIKSKLRILKSVKKN